MTPKHLENFWVPEQMPKQYGYGPKAQVPVPFWGIITNLSLFSKLLDEMFTAGYRGFDPEPFFDYFCL